MVTHLFRRATLCGALMLGLISSARADFYYAQDLGTLGGNLSEALALNNLGQVVGFSNISNNMYAHAVLFSGTGSNNIDLDVRGGNTTVGTAQGINDSGQVVGVATPLAGGRVEAILYNPSGTITLLGDLSDCGSTAGAAQAINNSGTIVGFADDCFFTPKPCRFSGTGTGNVELSEIGGGVDGVAYGINSSNQIAGYGTRSDQARRAALFNAPGASVEFGTLGGGTSLAYGINDAGQVVGTSSLAGNGAFHAVFFGGTSSNILDLGTLGGVNSHAYAINDLGEIVGNSYPATNDNSIYHAFIYKNGVMTDINGLVLTNSGFHNIRFASDGGQIPGRVINDAGQIAAMGEINGRTHAVLLTPVLRKVNAAINGKNVIVTFNAVAGKTYRLEQTVDLTNPNWQSVPGVSDFTAVNTGPAQFTYTNGLTLGNAYYRVRLL